MNPLTQLIASEEMFRVRQRAGYLNSDFSLRDFSATLNYPLKESLIVVGKIPESRIVYKSNSRVENLVGFFVLININFYTLLIQYAFYTNFPACLPGIAAL